MGIPFLVLRQSLLERRALRNGAASYISAPIQVDAILFRRDLHPVLQDQCH
jgi:hypothetical protein